MTLHCKLLSLHLLAVAAATACGCTKPPAEAPLATASSTKASPAHEHEAAGEGEQHPASLQEAVATVARLNTAIKEAIAAGDEAKADGPIHAVGHSLEDATELLPQANLSAAAQTEVKQAIEQLLDRFGEVDSKFHGGEGKTYDEVSDEITQALAALQKNVPANGEKQ